MVVLELSSRLSLILEVISFEHILAKIASHLRKASTIRVVSTQNSRSSKVWWFLGGFVVWLVGFLFSCKSSYAWWWLVWFFLCLVGVFFKLNMTIFHLLFFVELDFLAR